MMNPLLSGRAIRVCVNQTVKRPRHRTMVATATRPLPGLAPLSSAKLKNGDDVTIPASQLWATSPVVMFVIRRPGCSALPPLPPTTASSTSTTISNIICCPLPCALPYSSWPWSKPGLSIASSNDRVVLQLMQSSAGRRQCGSRSTGPSSKQWASRWAHLIPLPHQGAASTVNFYNVHLNGHGKAMEHILRQWWPVVVCMHLLSKCPIAAGSIF